MTTAKHVLVVGAGQAASEFAARVRMEGFSGPVTIVGAESHPPYQRPPLSKGYLSRKAGMAELVCRPLATYEEAHIGLVLDAQVAQVDRENQRVELADGRELPYDKLVLAIGGRPRRLPDGEVYEAANAHELRTVADSAELRESLKPGRRLVIIGAGYIGLEVAAVANLAGVHVTVLEAMPRVLARVTAPVVSAFYEQVHRDAGVDVRTGVRVEGFRFAGDGSVEGVACDDGATVPADAVLIGVGLLPNTELAQRAGLAVENGILVDDHSRTADPHVYAIGDCTSHHLRHADRRVRLESVPNALEQARSAAASIAGGDRPYTAAPWFWSDQYDVKLQTVGLNEGHDSLVVRGDTAARSFAVGYFRDGRLIAADAISRPREFTQLRKHVTARAPVDPERFADERVPLSELTQRVS